MTMQILSRGRLSRIITELELYPEESKEMTREEVISLMRSDIRIEPVLPELEVTDRRRQRDFEINTFRLYFRSESATTAAAVANRLANDFIDEHLKERVQVSGDTSEFIEAELDRLSTRIAEVEARIAEVKDANPGRLPEDLAVQSAAPRAGRRHDPRCPERPGHRRERRGVLQAAGARGRGVAHRPSQSDDSRPQARAPGAPARGVPRPGLHGEASRHRRHPAGDRGGEGEDRKRWRRRRG